MLSISMPRGDIRSVSFTVKDETKADVILDEIFFTVKENYNKGPYLFQKRLSTGEIERQDDGSYQFMIRPEDTNGLKFKDYVFDIEVLAGTDIKQTFVGSLQLTSEVTHAENEG